MALPLFPTSLVGSYAQPDWLIDREKLAGRFPPRTRVKELWRVPEPWLEPAWADETVYALAVKDGGGDPEPCREQSGDDATVYAVAEQERAGLDIVTDGEMRRESYSNRFATALEGGDLDNHGTALDRSGYPNPVLRVAAPVARRHPVQVRDAQFLCAHTRRTTKMTVPGPFTMSQQAQDDHYGSP